MIFLMFREKKVSHSFVEAEKLLWKEEKRRRREEMKKVKKF